MSRVLHHSANAIGPDFSMCCWSFVKQMDVLCFAKSGGRTLGIASWDLGFFLSQPNRRCVLRRDRRARRRSGRSVPRPSNFQTFQQGICKIQCKFVKSHEMKQMYARCNQMLLKILVMSYIDTTFIYFHNSEGRSCRSLPDNCRKFEPHHLAFRNGTTAGSTGAGRSLP